MTSFLQLIRYKNLLFILGMQAIMQQLIIAPVLQKYGFEYPFIDIHSLLLFIATICIAAAGYVINDYFDIKIDRINKPEKVLVSTVFSKRFAMLTHQILTVAGILCGLALAWMVKSFTLGFLFIAIPGLLWFYSASYKRQFLTGNIIVALLASLSVLITGITAVALLKATYSELVFETTIPREIYSWIGAFAVFAFLLTLIREIVKDMEDVEGDAEMECRTMPIVWGQKKSTYFVSALVVITITALLAGMWKLIPFEGNLTMKYILFTVIIPLIVLLVQLFRAKNKAHLHTISSLAKYIMLAGVLYAFVFYFLLAKAWDLSFFNIFILKQ